MGKVKREACEGPEEGEDLTALVLEGLGLGKAQSGADNMIELKFQPCRLGNTSA
jgi:hypothetical protein